MKKTKAHLQTKADGGDADAKARLEVFEGQAAALAKKLIGNFKDFEFFTGESMDPDGMVVLMNYREDGSTPYMIFWKDGLRSVSFPDLPAPPEHFPASRTRKIQLLLISRLFCSLSFRSRSKTPLDSLLGLWIYSAVDVAFGLGIWRHRCWDLFGMRSDTIDRGLSYAQASLNA